MPNLVADRLDVHHAIRDCWSSTHALEREAVLWAMDRSGPTPTALFPFLSAYTSLGPVLNAARTHAHDTPECRPARRRLRGACWSDWRRWCTA